MNNDSAIKKQTDIAKAKIAARRGVAVEDLPPVQSFKDAAKLKLPPRTKVGSVESLAEQDAFEASSVKATAKTVLLRVSSMAHEFWLAEDEVEKAEEALKKAKARVFRIASVDMPELLREAGVSEMTLEDGTKVAMKDEISCAITEANAHSAHEWLRKNGFGSLIKCEVTVAFGKDDYEKADKLVEQLVKRYGEDVKQTDKVHNATLKSFIKERIEAGVKKYIPPTKLFSIVPYSFAKVVDKKPAKGL